MRHLLFALGVMLGGVPVPAQTPDTSSLMSGATGVVLDSIDLRNGRGRTLADFLAGRVPGLLVTYESGQPSAAPRLVTRGSYGTFADNEPLLYIDGVLWRDDPNWSGAGLTWRLPSLGWQMPVDEIEEVRVHLGPVSGAMLEFGASRGAVEIVTRRPRDGRSRVRASVQASAMRYEPSPMRVVNRGVSGDPNTLGCTIGLAAEGSCIPGQTVSLEAFDLFPLHGSASGIDAQVEGSGSVRGTRYRAGVTRSALGGTLPSSDRSLTTLALSLDRAFGARWHATIDARAGSFDLGVADRWLYPLLSYPLSARPNRPDSTVYYSALIRDDVLWESPGRTGDRATVGGRVQYRLGKATRLSVAASLDRLWRGFEDSTDLGLPSPGPRRQIDRFELSTVHIGFVGEHRRAFGRHVQADFLARVGVTNSDIGERSRYEFFSDIFGWQSNGADYRVDLRQQSALGGVRVRVGNRLSLSGSVRHEEGKAVTIAPSLESFGGEYLLRRPRSSDGLSIVLVGGYGESVDHRTFGAKVQDWGRPSEAERTYEREVGLRVLRGARVEGSLVRSLTTVNDGLLRRPWTGLSGMFYIDVLDDASWRVDATTLAVTVRSAAAAMRPWRIAFSAMRRDHVALQTGYSGFVDLEQFPVSVRTQSGSPLDELVSGRYTYADTSGDGIISPGEITVGNTWEVVGHTEPRTILTFGGDIEPWRGVRVGTVVESRLGQQALDRFAFDRCRARNCPTLYDSTASLAEQAAAVAASSRGIGLDFVHDASFARIRELYVEAAPALLRGARVRLAVHQLLAWTAFPGGDPEARPRNGTMSSGEVHRSQPLYPSLSLRIDVDR